MQSIEVDSEGKADLLGTFEAHLILGVERSRIARFLNENRKGKPKIAVPVAEPQCGPIWTRAQLEDTAREMFEAAGSPGTFDEWLTERAVKRALALPNLSADDVARIVGRPLSAAQARQLRRREPVAA